jgi:hypothetical protein
MLVITQEFLDKSSLISKQMLPIISGFFLPDFKVIASVVYKYYFSIQFPLWYDRSGKWFHDSVLEPHDKTNSFLENVGSEITITPFIIVVGFVARCVYLYLCTHVQAMKSNTVLNDMCLPS